MIEAVVSLGSNIEPRAEFLARARLALAALPATHLIKESSVRETEPVDVPEEYAALSFLNQIVVCETDLTAEEFAHHLHQIEDDLGRVRTVRNGPRTIDLDLIDFGGQVVESDVLTLPHPRARARSFVLEPLGELGRSVDALIGPQAVRKELLAGNRVLLLVRHAERPKIDNEDKTFGAALPLTVAGEKMSEDFGALFKGVAKDIQFCASPLRRTVLTAQFIAKGLGLEDPEIPTDALIGNASAFVADELEIWELFRDGAFFPKMIDYLENGVQRGFNPLAEATENFERYCTSLFTAQFGIFTTHDVYIAAYAKGRGLIRHLVKENWPRFLDAIAIIIEPDGRRRHAFVRAGLTDGICGVV